MSDSRGVKNDFTSATVHVHETCVASLDRARALIDGAVQELGERFSFAQAWENTPLGRRIDFTRSEGWSRNGAVEPAPRDPFVPVSLFDEGRT